MVLEKKIKFKSSDGVEFELLKELALAAAPNSLVLKGVFKENATGSVPVLNVASGVLDKVMEFFESRSHFPGTDDDPYPEGLKIWDAKFVNVDQAMLYDLIMAAKYLNIPGLLFITCKAVADLIKGKTPDEIRKIFHLENNFSPEEEEENRKEMRIKEYPLRTSSIWISCDREGSLGRRLK